jgi:cell filamentation protein
VSSASGDPYLDPASGVRRNLLGITDTAELARAEAAPSASRLIDLERRRLPGRYDLAHLQAFHRYILGDVNAMHPFREGNRPCSAGLLLPGRP